MVNPKFQKVFKGFNISLAAQSKFSIKHMIKANFKEKVLFLKHNYLFWLFTIVPFKIDLKSYPIYFKWDDSE